MDFLLIVYERKAARNNLLHDIPGRRLGSDHLGFRIMQSFHGLCIPLDKV